MIPTLNLLSHLRRPRLLIRAARIGADDYSRSTHLNRLLGETPPCRHTEALTRLMSLEAEQEELRCAGSANCSVWMNIFSTKPSGTDLLSAMAHGPLYPWQTNSVAGRGIFIDRQETSGG